VPFLWRLEDEVVQSFANLPVPHEIERWIKSVCYTDHLRCIQRKRHKGVQGKQSNGRLARLRVLAVVCVCCSKDRDKREPSNMSIKAWCAVYRVEGAGSSIPGKWKVLRSRKGKKG
jgi:hypothetical protein